ITGKGGHGAHPHGTIDPVVCAAQMTMGFQTIISRNINPFDAGVVTVTQIHAGDADNVIPQTATVRGTTRAFLPEVREKIEERMQEIMTHTAAAHGCTAELTIYDGTQPVHNDPEVANKVREAIQPLLDEPIVLTERTTGAEDMGYFLNEIPGAFFFVGSANSDAGLDYGHHHPRFDFDERSLSLSVSLMTAAAAAYVLPESD
ncbi:MAG: amidohydrolase, partial [Chloroflexota bacterium]